MGGYGHGQVHGGVHGGQHGTGRRSSPNSSSHYSNQAWLLDGLDYIWKNSSSCECLFLQNWHEKKDLSMSVGGRCSWKFVAIVFILLSIIFLSALTYLAGKRLKYRVTHLLAD